MKRNILVLAMAAGGMLAEPPPAAAQNAQQKAAAAQQARQVADLKTHLAGLRKLREETNRNYDEAQRRITASINHVNNGNLSVQGAATVSGWLGPIAKIGGLAVVGIVRANDAIVASFQAGRPTTTVGLLRQYQTNLEAARRDALAPIDRQIGGDIQQLRSFGLKNP